MDKLILVEWVDAMDQENRWVTQEKAIKADVMTVISVGFLINENENIVTIIGDKDKNPNEDSEVGRVTTIPKGCIKNIKVLCVDCNCNNQ